MPDSRFSLLLLFGLVAAFPPTPQAIEPQSTFQWPAWKIPAVQITERGALSIVEDDEAESERTVTEDDGKTKEEKVALERRVNRREIAKDSLPVAITPKIPRANIAPGLYRVSARIKFDGEVGLIGTPIRLTVASGEPVDKDFAPIDFSEGDRYQDISFLYEVSPTSDQRLAPRKARSSLSSETWYHEIYPKAPGVSAPAKPPAGDGIQIALTLPKTKHDPQTGHPPNSLRSLRVDWIKLEQVPPAPRIRTVRAQKVWLRPGDENTFTIALQNPTAESLKRKLVVSLLHGLQSKETLESTEIELAPNSIQEVSIPWKTDAKTPLWGYELTAELLDGDRVESSARDYFSLHPEVQAVHVMGSNSRAVDPFRINESYQNLIEIFGGTPGDNAQILPEGESWTTGMYGGGTAQTYKLVKGSIDHNRANGIATHLYLFAGGTQKAVMDLAVTHPDWVVNRQVATDDKYELIAARDKIVREYDFENKPPLGQATIPHIEVHLNHAISELQEKIRSEAVEFVRRTGYEGIRFDVGIFGSMTETTLLGTPLEADASQPMQTATKNFNTFKDALRSEFPHFEFGANMDTWAYLEQVGNRKVTPKPPEDYPEFVAFAKAGGLFMDEGSMDAPRPDHYLNRFEDAFWSLSQKRQAARQFGGIYQVFSPYRDGTGHFNHDDIYWSILTLATGSYYVGSYAPMPYTEACAGAFITRFGEFFRSKNLKPLDDAADLILVDAPANVWYADATVWEDIGDRRRYVIPLLNPPVSDGLRANRNNECPEPINEPFPIEIEIPEGFTKAEAWMLTWEPKIESVPLPMTIKDGNAVVSFPGLQLFRTLVVEFIK